jgi:hypothetical protein
VLAADWQLSFKPGELRFGVSENFCLTESAEPRSDLALGQARCILANQYERCPTFFYTRVSVEIVGESCTVEIFISGNSLVFLISRNWMDV